MTSESYIAAAKEHEIHGLEINGMEVIFTDGESHQYAEYQAYRDYAETHYPNAKEVRIAFDGDDALIDVVLYRVPFERIRRITGYLTPVQNFNNGKRAELADRITHGGGQCLT